MTAAATPYETLQAAAAERDDPVESVCLGLTWTTCRAAGALGLAMSPGVATRTLPWPGTLAGRPLRELTAWARSWDPFEATVGLAACNAAINGPGNALMREAEPLRGETAGNLAVFAHFRPRLEGKRVVVVGRYPGMAAALDGIDVAVLERRPEGSDFPDPAAEFLLPEADWVFLTATSLINKTFHRLAALSADAVTVLMGPSTPWLAEWARWDVDFLAGVRIEDAARAERIAAEGGGVRLFEGGARYALADIGGPRLSATRAAIAETVARREALKAEMAAWYAAGSGARFPGYDALADLDARLSRLDTRYKRLFDARSGG